MKVLGPLTPLLQCLRDVPRSRCTQLEGAGGSHPPCGKGIAEDATEMKTFRFCASGGLGVCMSHQLPGETQAARSQPPLEQRGLSLSFRLQVMLPWSWRLLRATAQLPPQREACAVASVEGQELEPPRLILALSLTCSPLPSLTQLPFLEREPRRLFGCCLPTPPSRTTHSQASLVSGHRTAFLPRWSPAPPGQALQGRLLFPPRKKVEISQPQGQKSLRTFPAAKGESQPRMPCERGRARRSAAWPEGCAQQARGVRAAGKQLLWGSWLRCRYIKPRGRHGRVPARTGLSLSGVNHSHSRLWGIAHQQRGKMVSETEERPLGPVPRPMGLLLKGANRCFHEPLRLGNCAFDQMVQEWEILTCKSEDGALEPPTKCP